MQAEPYAISTDLKLVADPCTRTSEGESCSLIHRRLHGDLSGRRRMRRRGNRRHTADAPSTPSTGASTPDPAARRTATGHRRRYRRRRAPRQPSLLAAVASARLARSDDSGGHEPADRARYQRSDPTPAASKSRSRRICRGRSPSAARRSLAEGSARQRRRHRRHARRPRSRAARTSRVRFDTLTPRGDDERYDIETAAVGRTAAADEERRRAEDRRAGGGRRDHRRHRRRQERRGHRHGGRRRRRHRRRAVHARQGSAAAEGRRADAEADRAAHGPIRG